MPKKRIRAIALTATAVATAFSLTSCGQGSTASSHAPAAPVMSVKNASDAGTCADSGGVIMNPPGGTDIGEKPDFVGEAGAKFTISIFNLALQARMQSNAREAFVKGLVDEIGKSAGAGYNVMVADIKHEPDNLDPNGRPLISATMKGKPDAMFDIQYCQDWDSTKHTYRVWVFDSEAQFANYTDGGWKNWGYSGVYDTDKNYNTKTVAFKATPERNDLEHLKPRTLTVTVPGGSDRDILLHPTATNPRELVNKENEDRITVEEDGDLTQKVIHVFNKDYESLAQEPGKTEIRWTTFAQPIQRWTFEPDGERFKVVSEETGGAMHLSGDGFSASKTVSAASGGDATWEVKPEHDGYSSLRDADGQCLEQPIPNSTLTTSSCDGSDKQLWKLDGYATQSF